MISTISSKFEKVSQTKLNITLALLEDDNLRKWIYYLSEDPDSEPDVSIDDVLGKNVIMTRFNEEICQESRVFIFFDPFKGAFKPNQPTAEIWNLGIVLPNEFWYMKQTARLRPFEIAKRIAQVVDDQRLAGIGKVLIHDYEVFNINQRWTAVILYVEVVNQNIPYPKP